MNSERESTIDNEDRQGRILSLVLAGKSDRQIADELGVALETVSKQLARLELIAATTRSFNLVERIAEARRTSIAPASAPVASATPAPTAARRVLLADDHHINHLTIQAMLEDRGIEVVAAFDGAEAVEKFKSGPFDRVLMDIDMPVMDGMSAVRAIRSFEGERHSRPTPIAMFTALSGREVEAAAREAGADSYLLKPISLNQLYAFMGPLETR